MLFRNSRSAVEEKPQGFSPDSVMHVEYVYQGQELELYSLALLNSRTEHLWVAAQSVALILRPSAACTGLSEADTMRPDANASPLRPLFTTATAPFFCSGPVGSARVCRQSTCFFEVSGWQFIEILHCAGTSLASEACAALRHNPSRYQRLRVVAPS